MSTAPTIDVITGHLQTTSSTITTGVTFASTTGATHQVWAQIVGISTGSTEGGGWIETGTFKNVSGTLTQISTTNVTIHRDDTKWDASISASGTDILIRVLGDSADTIDWALYVQITTSLV